MTTKDITDLQVCMAIEAAGLVRRARIGWLGGPAHADAVLATITKQPPKVCYNALRRADARRLTDCGIGLWGGWLTEAGKALLANAPQVRDGWGSDYRVGSFVTRAGDDVHMLIAWDDTGDFLCVIPPRSESVSGRWIKQGEIESNLTRRYSPVNPGAIIDMETSPTRLGRSA